MRTVDDFLEEALTGTFGMISGRSLALGASTPWKRIKCNPPLPQMDKRMVRCPRDACVASDPAMIHVLPYTTWIMAVSLSCHRPPRSVTVRKIRWRDRCGPTPW
jgi:hypothetical protein